MAGTGIYYYYFLFHSRLCVYLKFNYTTILFLLYIKTQTWIERLTEYSMFMNYMRCCFSFVNIFQFFFLGPLTHTLAPCRAHCMRRHNKNQLWAAAAAAECLLCQPGKNTQQNPYDGDESKNTNKPLK